MEKTGITTTVPLEVLVAAGRRVVDLNNVFITGGRSELLVEEAEQSGFPRNVCAWIKGIYAAVAEAGIREVVAVVEGDCSNTRALMEVLSLEGIRTIPFAYPLDRDRASMESELHKLMRHLEVTPGQVGAAKAELDRIRGKVAEIDLLTWKYDRVSGGENHYFHVCTSDMNGDPAVFENEVDRFLPVARAREPFRDRLRLAYMGVPPVMSDLYPFLESLGARVVFNETQRQFAMPYALPGLAEQYLAYTYPYDIFHRLSDILPELARRRVDGVIHYVQSFCFRQIEDMIVRKKLPFPVLTLEGDKPGPVDARTRIRIEGFLEMLEERK